MAPRRAVTALLLVQLIALGGAAQQPAEFGRASGGELVMTPKGAAPFSGSLELSLSSGGGFGRGSSPGYGLTAGGTLIQDRLWVFGSAGRLPAFHATTPAAFLSNNTLFSVGFTRSSRVPPDL